MSLFVSMYLFVSIAQLHYEYIKGLGGIQNFKKSIFFAYLIVQYV